MDGNSDQSTGVTVKRKVAGRKKKFNGKLSHATNASPSKITKYFHKDCVSGEETNLNQISIALPSVTAKLCDVAAKRNALHEANSKVFQNNIDEDQYVTSVTREKSTVQEQQRSVIQSLSPASALSQLSIRCKKKISAKSRRRLVINFKEPEGSSDLRERIGITKSQTDLRAKYDINNTVQSQLTEYYPIRRSGRKTKNKVLAEMQKCLEEAVLSKKECGLKVYAFVGKGRGVVATRKFEKGEFVVEYAGELINAEIAHEREVTYAQDENTGCYMYYFNYKENKYCIDATAETDRLGRLLNHSRNGNLCPKTIEVNDIPRIVMIAKVDIQSGTELTYDYGDRSKKSLMYHPWLAQ